MTTLVPIRREQFSAFAETANAGYAQDNVRSGRWPSAEALALAKAEFEQLLPQGQATPNHHVYEIQDEPTGETVGFLWFAVVGASDARSAFIYNATVKQSFRRRRHAKAALNADVARAGLRPPRRAAR
jgi:ribosomal protein S18 acetylase RimI-like enzyme